MLGPQNLGQMHTGNPNQPLQAAPSYDFTARHLGDLMAPTAGRGTYIFFQWDKVLVAQPGGAPPIEQERLKRITQIIGDTSSISMEYITEDMAKRLHPREYQAFTETGDIPISGTSLKELPGVTVSIMQRLQITGIMSIEDLAECPDHLVSQISREAVTVKKLALEWLSRKRENAGMIERAERDAAMENYKNQLEAEQRTLRESNAALMAEVAAMRNMLAAGGQVPVGAQAVGAQIGDTNANAPSIMDMPSGMDDGSGVIEDNDILGDN